MKNIILILFITLFTGGLFAQKIKIKNDIATVDGVPYIQMVKQSIGFVLSPLNSEEEDVFVQWMNYKDPNNISKSNPEGYVRWVEFNFLGLDLKCEIGSQTKKSLIKIILENKLYVNGQLNEENVRKFVEKMGSNFSGNRPGGNVNIIINN
jgi:hypothetical protein